MVEGNSKFDVAIIGAGVVGTAIARRLSTYNLRVALLERNEDVGFGVSKANSGIVHGGFHHSLDTLKARLEIKGNLMFESLAHDLKFPFKRIGILVLAFSYEEMKTVEALYERGIKNGSPGIHICGRERLLALEPDLNPDVVGGLFAPGGGVVEPYRMVFAFCESAVKNGVDLKTSFKVVDATWKDGCYELFSENNELVRADYVINAAGLYADEVSKAFGAEDFKITPRKGEEFLLERNAPGCPKHVLFPVPTPNSKGVLVIPTLEGTMMVGPTAEMIDDKEDYATSESNLNRVFSQAAQVVPAISRRSIITAFSGLRPTLPGNDFYIDFSELVPNFIQVAGIQSPGLTAAPAIADYVKDLLKQRGPVLSEKTDYDGDLEKPIEIRLKSVAELDEIISKDPTYANIVCRCETVSEAQIVEAIKKGHHTLDGIKFYTRAGMGRCQGGFCSYKILKIIHRETGLPIREITKRGAGSELVLGRIKDA